MYRVSLKSFPDYKHLLQENGKTLCSSCSTTCPLSVTWVLDGGGWSMSRPARFTPGMGQCPLSRKLVGSQDCSGRVRKPPLPRGFDPRPKVSEDVQAEYP